MSNLGKAIKKDLESIKEKDEFVKDPASIFMEEDMIEDASELVDSETYLSMVNAVLDRSPEISLDDAANRVDDVLENLITKYKLVSIEEVEEDKG